jgi:hypothetical protein
VNHIKDPQSDPTELDIWAEAEGMELSDCTFTDEHIFITTMKTGKIKSPEPRKGKKEMSEEPPTDFGDENYSLSPEVVSRKLDIHSFTQSDTSPNSMIPPPA